MLRGRHLTLFCALQLRLNMPSPVRYKGISISDKDRKKHEGVTPHKVTWHGPSQLFFVATSRRMPFMHHLPPAEDALEDPHAAFAYKLAEEVARTQRGEIRYQIRGVTRDTLATACEVRMKPLETILSLETVRACFPAAACCGPWRGGTSDAVRPDVCASAIMATTRHLHPSTLYPCSHTFKPRSVPPRQCPRPVTVQLPEAAVHACR